MDGVGLLLLGVDFDVAGGIFAFFDPDGAGFEQWLFGNGIPAFCKGD